MNPRARLLAGAIAALASMSDTPATACDVCAVYTATEIREGRTGPMVGVAEQFSHFGTLQRGGDEVANPFGEKIDSSITQILAGYAPIPNLLLQANLPVIHRSFRRVEEGVAQTGSEHGIGDLSLLGQYALWTRQTEETIVRFTLIGGIKLPTGDSDRLREELEHGHGDEEGAGHDHEAEEPESGVHGHDLALGSGSIDGIVGARLFASRGRAFVTGGVQYAIRSEGDFDYRYADDLTWTGGPGYFLFLEHDHSLGLQAVLSGETKGKDELDGERLDDTAITALYVGPGVLFTHGSSFAVDVAGDLPVIQRNTALQIVPDYRIRGGVSFRF